MLFLFSALVVLLLTGAAWAFGFRAQPVLDRQSAIAEAEGRLAGFRTEQVALADCGRGAVLRVASRCAQSAGLSACKILISP